MQPVHGRVRRQLRGLNVITDAHLIPRERFAVTVQAAVSNGATVVQLREKEVPLEEVARLGRELLAVTRRYGAFGTPFPSVTKPPTSTRSQERSLDIFRQAKQRVALPVFAISGITLANAPQVITAGVDGIS